MPSLLPYKPYQWRGGKGPVADHIWRRLGDVHSYCEPFGGRLDTLFHRPPGHNHIRHEVVGDLDCMVANSWRACAYSTHEMAKLVDTLGLSTLTLLGCNHWLIDHKDRVGEVLLSHPYAHDVEVAAYWCYQQCCLVDTAPTKRKRRKMMIGFSIDMLKYPDNRQWFHLAATRLRRVRIIFGDFERTIRSVPRMHAYTYGYLFDPPYDSINDTYDEDEDGVAERAYQIAMLLAMKPNCRVAYCGFEGDFEFPGWTELAWKSPKSAKENRGRERIWFSPHCLTSEIGQDAA